MTSAIPLLLISVASANAPSQAVLLEFTADYCGPCQEMSPVVSKLKREGYPIRQINISQNPKLSRRFRLQGVPTFVLIVDGQEVDRIVGACSESKLKRLLSRIPKTSGRDTSATDRSGESASRGPRGNGARSPGSGSQGRSPGRDRNGGRSGTGPESEPVSKEAPVIRANLDAAPSTADPLKGSVRIQVRDGGGVNYGSGTVVASRPGQAVVLTCGHIFRNLDDDAEIQVDVFAGDGFERYSGRVIDYDLKADVGLLGISAEGPLPVSPVAGPGDGAAEGDHVFSIGCGSGDPPSKLQARVTAHNRYLGPENIECTGVPDQGRSGGGLFNTDGELVGVCSAADPKEKRGLYAGLKPIHRLLDEAGLSQAVKRSPRDDRRDRFEGSLASLESESGREASGDFPFSRETEPPRESEPPTEEGNDPTPVDSQNPAVVLGEAASSQTETSREAAGETSADQIESLRSAVEEAGDAEVVCIIRPLENPQAASRVVIINRASSKFVSYLEGELDEQPQPTSARVRFPEEGQGRDELAAALQQLASRSERPASGQTSRKLSRRRLQSALGYKPATQSEEDGTSSTRRRYRRSPRTR